MSMRSATAPASCIKRESWSIHRLSCMAVMNDDSAPPPCEPLGLHALISFLKLLAMPVGEGTFIRTEHEKLLLRWTLKFHVSTMLVLLCVKMIEEGGLQSSVLACSAWQ